MHTQRWVAAMLGCLMLAGILARAAEAANEDPAAAQNRALARGVNVIGYDPLWRNRDQVRFTAEHFRLIREAGFDHVRINLHPFRDARPDASNTLPERYLKTLDWALDQALAMKLRAVLDFHEFTAMARNPQGKREAYLAIWRQIAERCKGRPPEVLFELLNEPNGELTPELWNEFLKEALAVVRQSNPKRTVIVGPGMWNGINALDRLRLPEDDRNLIVTVHYYHPMAFTHQGASWTSNRDKVGVPWNGTDEEQAAVRRDFDKATAWARANARPIYLGEFGAYDKGEMASRVRWTSFVAREAEKRGWSWAYWQFDNDFIVYDIRNGKWVEPIRDALIPKAK